MGFFDSMADRFEDAKRSAKRSARKARKATNSDTTLEAVGKIVGRKTGEVAGAVAATAMEFGSAAYDKVVEKNAELNELKDEFRRYDDDRMLWTLNHSSGFRKMAAASILKERGYDLGRN